MTKKHFIAFAREIREYVLRGKPQVAEDIFRMVVLVAEESNPRFDRERFRKACGL